MVSSSSVPLKLLYPWMSWWDLMRFDELKLTGKALSSLEGGEVPSLLRFAAAPNGLRPSDRGDHRRPWGRWLFEAHNKAGVVIKNTFLEVTSWPTVNTVTFFEALNADGWWMMDDDSICILHPENHPAGGRSNLKFSWLVRNLEIPWPPLAHFAADVTCSHGRPGEGRCQSPCDTDLTDLPIDPLAIPRAG